MATVTISTHNGHTAHREHNIRNRKVTDKEAHIDRGGRYEIWHDEKPREAYERIFGEAVKAYNEKQTREDRKITSYYNEVSKDAKKHPVYEMIVGVYGEVDEKTKRDILLEFARGWTDRNPNLELIGCYFHADEQGDIHIHIDYVPVAHGYTKGLEIQSGLVKALGEQGFQTRGKHNTAQIQWEKRENDTLDALCRARGLEVDHPMIEGRKHLETDLYKAQKALEGALDNTRDLLNAQDELRAQTAKLEKQRDHANQQTQKALERKSKAVKRSFKKVKDGDGWTYDKKTADEVKQIAKDMKEDVKAISHTEQDVVIAMQEADYTRADAQRTLERAQREAEAKLKEAQQIRDQAERLVNQRAQALANQQFREFLNREYGRNPRGREGKLEDFLEKYTIKGQNLLEIFNAEQEQERARLSRSWGYER